MKNYYIQVTMGEGIPDYDFVIKALDNDEARQIAWAEIDESYPSCDMSVTELQCQEITAEELLAKMTLN